MKQNFSNSEFQIIKNMFKGNLFDVRFNRAGNIQLDVKDLSKFNVPMYDYEHPYGWKNRCYVFYNTDDGILIRCKSWAGSLKYGASIFPLNKTAKSRNVAHHMTLDGHEYNWVGYDIKCLVLTKELITILVLQK